MPRYRINHRHPATWPRNLLLTIVVVVALVIAGMIGVRVFYNKNLSPVSKSGDIQTVVVEKGATVSEVGDMLQEKKLIRSSLVFYLYIRSKDGDNPLIAGTYRLSPSYSTPQIASILSKGAVASDLVTIYPARTLEEIEKDLINSGFDKASVAAALDPAKYAQHPALVDKPAGASLEGYLYPESFQKSSVTTPEEIITKSLDEMNTNLSPDIRAAFAAHGLNVYQGITLASIVEQEAGRQGDRSQIAQVFLARLKQGMALQSDPTAKYGAHKAGHDTSPLTYDSPYNTYIHKGLPPTPISNVSKESLTAVAYPSHTNWLYFVSGDDGRTHFSRTLEEHEANTKRYCSALCGN